MHSCFDDFTLLVDGAEAFEEILFCIRHARRSIHINMFIWRDDHIGNAIAQAILQAADRGVRVFLSIDRVGAILEYAEEHRSSFFHRHLNPIEWVKVQAIRRLYPSLWTKCEGRDRGGTLHQAILCHPNIDASIHARKADHSKYYIFDDEILILGGINIEDKENGEDIQGRIYQDYMVKMTGASYVSALKDSLSGRKAAVEAYGFCVNSKECKPHCFEMEAHYLSLIRQAQQELLIIMAYFAPPETFVKAIADACRRGVRVTLMIPARSNLMNSASLRTARRLMRDTHGGIELYLSPKMLHTKLIANERQISLGSANLMKNAFRSLSELNVFVRRMPHPFCQRIMDSAAENIALARKVGCSKELRYSPILAWLEEIFV